MNIAPFSFSYLYTWIYLKRNYENRIILDTCARGLYKLLVTSEPLCQTRKPAELYIVGCDKAPSALLSPARLHQDYDRMFRDILFELCLEIGVDQFDTSGTNGKWKLPRPRPVQAAAFHLRHPDSQQYFLKTVQDVF
ncbi:conserved hypothetical protein [Trichinella spiralis]|uniref:hypothetical protein n=1 Tax=Trichinella spiralis TaxID=6334 RepID=UPI0001EFCB15|nr:conserved hypothetical protein [Trichinella spiralis]